MEKWEIIHERRKRLKNLLFERFTLQEISDALGVSKTTVIRDLECLGLKKVRSNKPTKYQQIAYEMRLSGHLYKEIATKLGVTVATAHTHVKLYCSKKGLKLPKAGKKKTAADN